MSRLSHDSKRSETGHMALMKHFNRSCTELAAGAGRYYMKPQVVIRVHIHVSDAFESSLHLLPQRKQGNHTDHLNSDMSGAPRESNTDTYMAIYVRGYTVSPLDNNATY